MTPVPARLTGTFRQWPVTIAVQIAGRDPAARHHAVNEPPGCRVVGDPGGWRAEPLAPPAVARLGQG